MKMDAKWEVIFERALSFGKVIQTFRKYHLVVYDCAELRIRKFFNSGLFGLRPSIALQKNTLELLFSLHWVKDREGDTTDT